MSRDSGNSSGGTPEQHRRGIVRSAQANIVVLNRSCGEFILKGVFKHSLINFWWNFPGPDLYCGVPVPVVKNVMPVRKSQVRIFCRTLVFIKVFLKVNYQNNSLVFLKLDQKVVLSLGPFTKEWMIENSLFGGKEPATHKKILSTRSIYILLNQKNFFAINQYLGTTLIPCLGMIATERVRSPATAGTPTYGIKLIFIYSEHCWRSWLKTFDQFYGLCRTLQEWHLKMQKGLTRVCWPLLCLCRPYCNFEWWLDSNPESCRSKHWSRRATNLATLLPNQP